MEKRIYTIGGTLWYQEQLTYEEVGAASVTLSQFSKIFEGEKLKFSEIAGKIYEAGLVPQLFAVVLKPHYPDPWSFVKHWFFRLAHRVSRRNLARTLKLEEIFGVLADFFFINTQWIENLMTSNDLSDTRTKALSVMQTMMGLLFPLGTLPSSSPAVTSPGSSQPSDSSEAQKQSPSGS